MAENRGWKIRRRSAWLTRIIILSYSMQSGFQDGRSVEQVNSERKRIFLPAMMTSEEQAREKVLAGIDSLPVVSAPLSEALGCFVATDVVATLPLPSFDNSAMDGYALQADSAATGARLRVVGEQPAGTDRRLSVRAGEAVRIFTGAIMPEGADAVVMQEETERAGEEVVIRSDAISRGDFIRKAGADLAAGQLLLRKGDRLTTTAAALLATQGTGEAQVYRRPQVAILTTGSELMSAGKPLARGQIYNSNGLMLAGLARAAGAEVALERQCSDSIDEVSRAFEEATLFDAVVVSGGVSVGDHDLVRRILEKIGARTDLWRVAVKPGKPFLFGRRQRCAIFGLPGNPVSSFVTFHIFVRPALLRMMGANEAALAPLRALAKIEVELTNEGDRPHYLRGQCADGAFRPVGLPESHAVFGLSRANALIRLAPEEKILAGEMRLVLLLP